MALPQKTKQIEVNGNNYTVTYPNNRQFISIYSRKAQLTKEQYDGLQYSLDGNARYAGMLVTAIATFEQIMPEEFFKDLNISSILEGDVLAGAQLVVVYRDQVEDWLAEWDTAIAEVLKPKKEEEKKANE